MGSALPLATARTPRRILAGPQRPFTCTATAAPPAVPPKRTQLPPAAQDNEPEKSGWPGPAPVMTWGLCQMPFFSVDTNVWIRRGVETKPTAVHAPAAGQPSCSIPYPSLNVPGKDVAVPQRPCASVTANAPTPPASGLVDPAATQFPAEGHDSALMASSAPGPPLTSCALPQIPCLWETTNDRSKAKAES